MALLQLEDGRVVEADAWTLVDDTAELPPDGAVAVAVPLARWRRERETLIGRPGPLGVRLQSHERADALAGDLERLTLIVLEMGKFRDGRHFSTVRELRDRHGFRGEVRVSGHVIPDQAQFFARAGATSIALPAGSDPAPWQHALREISIAYQAGSRADSPLSLLRRRIATPPSA